MMKFITLKILSICAMALLLASCGGKTDYSIGGSVSGPGVSASNPLVLQNNGGDTLNVTGSSFAFATQLEAGSTYIVTILTQPVGQTCYVENGIGVVETSIGNVNSIAVVCDETSSASNEILGTVKGLATGQSVNLTDNGTDPITVKNNGSFQFPMPLATGASYNVEVSGPAGTSCKATSNTGVVPSTGIIPPVLISC